MVGARTPAGCLVEFRADTVIGRALWTCGTFERQELVTALRLARLDTCAFDVGANVGLFTVDMSRAVGPGGVVIAVEPVASTAELLRSNLDRNGCTNVRIVVGAAGPEPGHVRLLLTDDPAHHSAGGLPNPGHPILGSTTVPSHTVDQLWFAEGTPKVSLVKIDVEGGEKGVLLGAARMITTCRPPIIVEVRERNQLAEVVALLPGYTRTAVSGFEPWNHLLVPE